MRTIILVFLVLLISNTSFAQYKAVELNIDSTKMYLRYFYRSKIASDESLNDSVSVVARKITEDKFYLYKFINKKKIWTRIYKIELAQDSMSLTTRSFDNKGKSRFVHSKEPYYKSFLIVND